MIERGLEEEAALTDKQRLAKIERCWSLAGQRVLSHPDHLTLMKMYNISDMEYLSRKAPGLVSSCYWRIKPEELKQRRPTTPEELEALFGSGDGQPNTPALTP